MGYYGITLKFFKKLPQVLSHLITLLGACYVARRAHTSVQLGKAAWPGIGFENLLADPEVGRFFLDVLMDWLLRVSFWVPRGFGLGVKWCRMGCLEGLATFDGSNGGSQLGKDGNEATDLDGL